MVEGKLCPFALQFVLVQVSQLAGAFLGGNVVDSMGLLFAHGLTELKPSAGLLVNLPTSVTAATA